MAKTVKMLLTENVDTIGIVGDVVNVRLGFARNFLLPQNLATIPSDDKIKELAAKRAQAEKDLAEQRKQREATIQKIDGLELTLQRSCNDQGLLYGAVTQQDIAAALGEVGYKIKPRDVRLAQTIKRIDTYDVHIKLDQDLDATLKLWVVADRELDLDEEEEVVAASSENAPTLSGDTSVAEQAEKAASGGGKKGKKKKDE